MVRTAHTSQLDAATLEAARRLVFAAFGPQLTDRDWEHALGGMHALAWEDGELVGHASVVQRRVLHAGRALRTGYVEAVGVRPYHRGRGHAHALMAALERIVRGAYELGALGATEAGARIYAQRGWQLWRGPTSTLAPDGIVRTPEDDGSIFVLPVTAQLDLDGELSCDHRDGDVW
jgi:aminoglycoside 2'-N-acetyltransferase I